MAKIQVLFDAASQEFYETEADKPLGPVERERRRKAMAKYICETGCTIRDVASVFGLHNANVYRALAGLLGYPYTDVHEVWMLNKSVSLERANAVRKARRLETKRKQQHAAQSASGNPGKRGIPG